ncbi:MAG: excisionase family DNA-binding protein [Candidatus Anammoxibacter sp.]
MKIEINDNELVDAIVKRVVAQIAPLLNNSHDSKGDDLMDVVSLAEYLRVQKDWIYAHVKDIPHYKVGRFPRFKRKTVDKWLESNKGIQRVTKKMIYNR